MKELIHVLRCQVQLCFQRHCIWLASLHYTFPDLTNALACAAGNVVMDAAYAPLLLTSVHDAFLGNNTFTNAVCNGAPVVGNAFNWLAPASAAVFIDNANASIRLSDNLFVRDKGCTVGPNASNPVSFGPSGGADQNSFLFS